MASDDPLTFQFHSSLQDGDFENDIDDDDHGQHPHPHNMSRLSVSNSSTMCGVDDAMAMYMSGLSIESFEGDGDDADGELSDGKEMFSDFEENEYGSDNEDQRGVFMEQKTKEKDPWRCGRIRKDTWVRDSSEKNRSNNKSKKKEEEDGVEGLSDQSGVRVITRPKGGRRSLCMDLEEVKACRDLGFELEMEIPSPLSVSLSNSTLDTSSGGTSPITDWRISSPGDDPRHVKARLKMWAQAVAASASKYGT